MRHHPYRVLFGLVFGLVGCAQGPLAQTGDRSQQGAQIEGARPSYSVQAAIVRPLSDFLSKQGTFCVDFGGGCVTFLQGPPAIPNQSGWSPEKGERFAVVDYAGLAANVLAGLGKDLGTTVTGTVLERPLGNGTSEVKVTLHTHNALAWASEGVDPNGDGIFDNDPLLFGTRAADVLAGKTPALADSRFALTFINPTNADLPDLMELFFGGRFSDIKVLGFEATAKGTLTDGSPAILHILQRGLIGAPVLLGQNKDFFPGELVDIIPTP